MRTRSALSVRKTYDTANRISRTSNPFRAGETVQWTTAAADLLGRLVSVTTPDNAVVSTVYNGNTVTVTDQAGKQRRSVSDALGRLREVYEAPNNPTDNYLTSYDYDVLGNLTNVIQDAQIRTFSYDSLSRLRSATNPEVSTPQGVMVPVTYVYDDNGNLTSKTDARGVVTNYGYDALNRVISKSYQNDPTGTPAVTYSYDSTSNGKGRLAFVSSSVSTYTYSGYDATGRALGASQTLGNQTYTFSNVYGLSGQLKSMNYPSGRTVNYTHDNAGRTSGFSGNLGDSLLPPRTYASAISYSASGGMTNEQFGTDR